MNKAELVATVAERVGLPKVEVEQVVDSLLHVVSKSLLEGDEVKLSGFGVFSVKERAARTGTNPSSGKRITIPASKTVNFKVSSKLKERLN